MLVKYFMMSFMTTWHSWDDSHLWFVWYYGIMLQIFPKGHELKGLFSNCIRVLRGDASFQGKEWEESCYGGTQAACAFSLSLTLLKLLFSSFFLLLCDEISVICLPVCVLSLFPGINEANRLFYNTLQICFTSSQGTGVS